MTAPNYTLKVGIFTGLALLTICISIFSLGGKNFLKPKVRLHVRFQQIQGLAVGSVVSLSGLAIGNIEKVKLLKDENTMDLTLSIDEQFQSRITSSSRADIRTQGALGDKFIFITPGNLNEQPLPEDALVLTAISTDIFSVLSDRGDQATKIFDIMNDVHVITQTLTHDNKIGKILTHLETSSEQMGLLIKDVRGINPESHLKLAQSLVKLDRVLAKIDSGQGSLGQLINDKSLHEQLKTLLGTQKRTQNIRNMIRSSIEEEKSQ